MFQLFPVSRLCRAMPSAKMVQHVTLVGNNFTANTLVPSRRYLFKLSGKKTFQPQYKKDKVSKEFSLVYESSMENVIGPVRIAWSTGALITSSMVAGYLYTSNLDSMTTYSFIGVGLFCLASIVFVNWMSRFYLLRIYHNRDVDKFIGVYQTFIGRRKHVTYSLTDVQPARPIKKDSHLHTQGNVCIKGRTFHFQVCDFVLPKYYNMHFGL